MRKVLLYSLLLVAGLVASQFLSQAEAVLLPVRLLTMIALSFIMVHVGYEFEIDKSRPRQYAWDYTVAFTAAAFPWVFCALYFVLVMTPSELWSHPDQWKESLLQARFASPTSAGVLFSMLAAAGLGATWVFAKARVLAIFDDLDTILLLIPLQMLMVGPKWQLGVVVVVILVLLWLAWRYLHAARWPIGWPWVLGYATGIALASELIYVGSKAIDAREGVEEGPESPREQFVSTIVSACFMVLVGLSMPPITGATPVPAPPAGGEVTERAVDVLPTPAKPSALAYAGVAPQVLAEKRRFPGWGMIAVHVVVITLLSNLGKMFPAFCYRREATLRERLALSIGMFPRGEVGAGVLVISLSYGLGGPALTVAVLSLALNLLCTGLFILAVKRLIAPVAGDPHQVTCTQQTDRSRSSSSSGSSGGSRGDGLNRVGGAGR